MKKVFEISNHLLTESADIQFLRDVSPPVGHGRIPFVEYWRLESAYIEIVLSILSSARIDYLYIGDLENNCDISTEDFVDKNIEKEKNTQSFNLKIGDSVRIDKIEAILRACLREEYWCRLHYEDKVIVTIGYDLYLFVGLNFDFDLEEIIKNIPSSPLVGVKVLEDGTFERTNFFYFGAKAPIED